MSMLRAQADKAAFAGPLNARLEGRELLLLAFVVPAAHSRRVGGVFPHVRPVGTTKQEELGLHRHVSSIPLRQQLRNSSCGRRHMQAPVSMS